MDSTFSLRARNANGRMWVGATETQLQLEPKWLRHETSDGPEDFLHCRVERSITAGSL